MLPVPSAPLWCWVCGSRRPPGGVPATTVFRRLTEEPCGRPSRFKSGTVGPPLRLWWRRQQSVRPVFRGAPEKKTSANTNCGARRERGRPLESKVCPIICCGLKTEPPERGRGTPRDSRTSKRRKNDEVLGTLEPLRHSRGLDDERLPPEDPFPTGITSPMAFHPLHLPLPALPKCGLRHVSPEHSSRTR